MIKWTKIDPPKRNCGSFMPHDYVADTDHLSLRIVNNSFSRRKGAWVLTTKKGTELQRFDTLRAAKEYAETLA